MAGRCNSYRIGHVRAEESELHESLWAVMQFLSAHLAGRSVLFVSQH